MRHYFRLLLCILLTQAVSVAQVGEDCTVIADGVIRVMPKQLLDPAELDRAVCRSKSAKSSKKVAFGSAEARSGAAGGSLLEKSAINRANLGRGGEAHLKPAEVTLDGAQRNFSFNTPMGPLHIRWQVESTPFFGTEPYFLVKDAWAKAARSLARRAFPSGLRSAKFDWQMVFLDKEATARAYPWAGEDCHPAWIRPPAHIFVSAYMVGTRCGRNALPEKVARERLQGTLFHEFGHAIEYQLLGSKRRKRERYHSEGFAMWFEALALRDHGLDAEAQRMRQAAKKYFRSSWDPTSFNGSYEHYVQAYAMIETLVEKRELRRLLKVYDLLAASPRSLMRFADAVQIEVGWDLDKWRAETQRYLVN